MTKIVAAQIGTFLYNRAGRSGIHWLSYQMIKILMDQGHQLQHHPDTSAISKEMLAFPLKRMQKSD